jgi:hypothetical protein
LRSWQEAAGITAGAVFRRIWIPPRGRDAGNTPLPRVGTMAIDAGTVARIIQARAARAGFDAKLLGGHSLKRGALSTAFTRPASSSSAATRPMRCSTNTSNSATRSTVTRSTASSNGAHRHD